MAARGQRIEPWHHRYRWSRHPRLVRHFTWRPSIGRAVEDEVGGPDLVIPKCLGADQVRPPTVRQRDLPLRRDRRRTCPAWPERPSRTLRPDRYTGAPPASRSVGETSAQADADRFARLPQLEVDHPGAVATMPVRQGDDAGSATRHSYPGCRGVPQRRGRTFRLAPHTRISAFMPARSSLRSSHWRLRTVPRQWTARNWPDLPPDSVELHGSEGRAMLTWADPPTS